MVGAISSRATKHLHKAPGQTGRFSRRAGAQVILLLGHHYHPTATPVSGHAGSVCLCVLPTARRTAHRPTRPALTRKTLTTAIQPNVPDRPHNRPPRCPADAPPTMTTTPPA